MGKNLLFNVRFNVRFPWAALSIIACWLNSTLVISFVRGINVLVVLLITILMTIIFSIIGFKIPE